ncbi:MAG: ATP synthase F0 subunit B [Candidatus Cloacimonetes bacterium 4572_65]|nr:MAG: ATP synthase F0 subunit B [Candidatus Cloacimonetes bacterium 4572_65]
MISIDVSLVVVVLNFLLLMFILQKVLYKPIKDMLQKRETQVLTDIDEANKSKEDAKILVEQKDKEYKNSISEARVLRDKIKKEAEYDAEKIIQEAYENRKSIVSETEQQLVNEKIKVKKALEKELAALVSNLSGQVLSEKITSDKDRELINRVINTRSK